jgi:hypothetical protein
MHAQTVSRRMASDPGNPTRRRSVWIAIAVAISIALLAVVVLEGYVRTRSTIEFRGLSYKAMTGCKALPKGVSLTTIGSLLGHPINGPSGIDHPAVIYVRCYPSGYREYQTLQT